MIRSKKKNLPTPCGAPAGVHDCMGSTYRGLDIIVKAELIRVGTECHRFDLLVHLV